MTDDVSAPAPDRSTPGGLRLDHLVVDPHREPPSRPLDLELARCGVLILIGDPDASPSAVLRVVAGLDEPAAGRVERLGSVGLVTRQHHLLGALTAAENVAVAFLDRPGTGRIDGRAVEAQLERLDVPESSWHNLLEQLSGGQQQRVAVARALIASPAVLCLDDPTSELDQASADVVWREVEAARGRGACIVTTAVTHAEATALADRFADAPQIVTIRV